MVYHAEVSNCTKERNKERGVSRYEERGERRYEERGDRRCKEIN